MPYCGNRCCSGDCNWCKSYDYEQLEKYEEQQREEREWQAEEERQREWHEIINQEIINERMHDAGKCDGVCNYCHDAGKCGGGCNYCIDEEHDKIYRYMYEGFFEQYGPMPIYDFMVVKKELFDYFEQKYYQQHADKYKQIMAELSVTFPPPPPPPPPQPPPPLPMTFPPPPCEWPPPPMQRHETYFCLCGISGCTTSNPKCKQP